MNRLLLALPLVAVLVCFGHLSVRAEDSPLTSKQQEAVKKLVHDYLMEHPEAIIDAIQAYRDKQREAADVAAKKTLVDRKNQLINDPSSPVMGNPNGDVTVVEFFDYRCPYCKAMIDSVLDIVTKDGKVRMVMKELPILSPESAVASRAALASRRQKLYPAFHTALMHLKGPLNEASIMATATSVGLNIDQLKQDMKAPEIDATIQADLELARALNIDGTPGWIVGDQITSGAMSPQAFKQLIDAARKPKT